VSKPRPPESRARELIAEAFAGTPGRMRLFGGITVAACVLFGGLAFILVNRLDDELRATRAEAAQLVRIQTIRTNLVKADANATNAFLVGGLEPSDTRLSYSEGIATAAATLAEASSTDKRNAKTLEAVNKALAQYTGTIEAARTNNRQGFPIGAAYLREASRTLQRDALQQLQGLVDKGVQRVNASSSADNTRNMLLVLGGLVLAALLATQLWLYRRTHRMLNPPLVAATSLVLAVGVIGLLVVAWSGNAESDARKGPYTQTVALTNARINAFDAKSAESLTLILHGSGQAYEDRFKVLSTAASGALSTLGRTAEALDGKPDTRELDASSAFDRYLTAHAAVRKADTEGRFDDAVGIATGTGDANSAFKDFETRSGEALQRRANQLSDDLADARFPLVALSWVMLASGLAAAFAARRGIARRLREYR
jgi:hypothetical protein